MQEDTAIHPQSPRRLFVWVLAILLLGAYFVAQLVPGVAYLAVRYPDGDFPDMDTLGQSDEFAWALIIGLALGGLATIGVAWLWPRLWPKADASQWLAWRPPQRLAWWVIVLITLPLAFGVAYVTVELFGAPEVAIQEQLFSVSTSLTAVAAVVVATLAPVAEELIFRGALYNGLLPAREPRRWTHHILPLLATSATFALLHLAAGFETAGAVIQIAALAIYLGALRAVTGSVQGSLIGHVSWNMLAAIGLALMPR